METVWQCCPWMLLRKALLKWDIHSSFPSFTSLQANLIYKTFIDLNSILQLNSAAGRYSWLEKSHFAETEFKHFCLEIDPTFFFPSLKMKDFSFSSSKFQILSVGSSKGCIWTACKARHVDQHSWHPSCWPPQCVPWCVMLACLLLQTFCTHYQSSCGSKNMDIVFSAFY